MAGGLAGTMQGLRGKREEREREGEEEGEGEGEGCFHPKFRGLFMLTPHFLCSLRDSNPLLLTSVVNIKQRTVNSITQPSQTKVNPIFWLTEFPIFIVFY